jgi:SSS family solute:Na+ symporter
VNIPLFSVIVIVYLLVIGYLGYLGYRGTKTSGDYMIAGRQIHPYVMAISYGATFISTSAIVGFGGAAGVFGMGLLWLTFLNIGLGIAVAFILFGKRTRRIGLNLDAHTFPEFLGRRYDSKFIQVLGGIVIFVFMPLYTGVVLIGAARFLESTFNLNFVLALAIFSIIVAAYVIVGGLKGVMYTDALQGSIMFIGMITLLVSADI